MGVVLGDGAVHEFDAEDVCKMDTEMLWETE